MPNPQRVQEAIRRAFASSVYPGDDQLRGSDMGDEPYEVEQAFRGKRRWQDLDPRWLDEVPDGLSSALSFLSDAAFRFYLPAYLLADLNEQLERVTPVFHLTQEFLNRNLGKAINPRVCGELTWDQYGRQRCDPLTHEQTAAIVDYLRVMARRNEFDNSAIDQALSNYWLPKRDSNEMLK